MAHIAPSKQNDRIEEVKQLFSSHLDTKNQRKTPERFAILEEIYSRSDHFDVESLYIHMKNNNYRVSRATVYNTLDLLVECDLVRRHQFGSAQALYEKSYGYKQHDHFICTSCGKVLEFCDPRLGEIEKTIGELLQVNVHHHAFTLYGTCNDKACSEQAS